MSFSIIIYYWDNIFMCFQAILEMGRMEKQETDADAESGHGRGKRKRAWKILQALKITAREHRQRRAAPAACGLLRRSFSWLTCCVFDSTSSQSEGSPSKC